MKKESREQKAVKRLAEALKSGATLQWGSSYGGGTIGPYYQAVGPSSFAIFYDGVRWKRTGLSFQRFSTASEAAVTLASQIGVSNVIESLKAAGGYKNLDTPFVSDLRQLLGR